MERRRIVDLTRPAAKSRALILAVFLLAAILPVIAQHSPSADEIFQSGIAHARQQQWQDAKSDFLRGRQLFPADPRFATELGGVAFQQKNYDEALAWLRLARKLKPGDAYVNDFLGSIYYMTGERYAALTSWNRVGKPTVASVRTEPMPRLDPIILDRAFAFAPGDQLTTAKLLTTEARLRALDVFSRSDFYIAAREDGKFDVTLYDVERQGFGRNKWDILLTNFGALPGYAITPRYYNIGNAGINFAGLVRFDPEKRRGAGMLSGPIHRNPRWMYHLGGDFRNENWNLRNFSALPGSQLGSLNLRRTAANVDIDSIVSGKWSWGVGGEYSYRDFRSATGAVAVPGLLLQGSQLKQRAQINYEILRLPEQHLVIGSSAKSQLGRIWTDSGASTFFKAQGFLATDWSLNRKGDDYQMLQRFSAGGVAGDVPFDELFQLGIDGDNTELKMRAHIGTDRRRKGNAPLGQNYFLSNWELDKNAYSNGLFRITLGPFVDTGKITDPLSFLGTDRWLWDTGAQAKFKAFGVQLIVLYGKDLRTGSNTAYAYVGR